MQITAAGLPGLPAAGALHHNGIVTPKLGWMHRKSDAGQFGVVSQGTTTDSSASERGERTAI
jgi:hypothetical protein